MDTHFLEYFCLTYSSKYPWLKKTDTLFKALDAYDQSTKADAPASANQFKDRYIRPKEAVLLLGFSRKTLYNLTRAGELHAIRLTPGHKLLNNKTIGGVVVYSYAELLEFIRRRGDGSAVPSSSPTPA